MTQVNKFKVGDRVRKVYGLAAPYEMTIDDVRGDALYGVDDNGKRRGGDLSRFYELVPATRQQLESCITECESKLKDLRAQLERLDRPEPAVGQKWASRSVGTTWTIIHIEPDGLIILRQNNSVIGFRTLDRFDFVPN